MMTERFTALELTVDRLQQRLAASEELAAATASQLASYKLAMPKARGYYALIQIPDNLSELHARRAVLEAARSVTRSCHVEVLLRCFVHDLTRRDVRERNVVVLYSEHTMGGPQKRVDGGELYAALSRLGEMQMWHCALEEAELSHIRYCTQTSETFSLVRNEELAALSADERRWFNADPELGWCRWRPGIHEAPVDEELVEQWVEQSGFSWWIAADQQDR